MIGQVNTTVQNTLPSYLYFQYLNDKNLQALVDSYNEITQSYVDDLNTINLPIYTQLSGDLLNWVGAGVYGYPRPVISSVKISGITGQIASFATDESSTSSAKVNSISNSFTVSDDFYKRILTWFFYKGDGDIFSIPWLKRRVYRFLYGINGTDATGPFTPDISVEFVESPTDPSECVITLTNPPAQVGEFFQTFVTYGNPGLPFYFTYTVNIV